MVSIEEKFKQFSVQLINVSHEQIVSSQLCEREVTWSFLKRLSSFTYCFSSSWTYWTIKP